MTCKSSTYTHTLALTLVSSSPCSRLDYDTLCEIFYWCAEMDPPRALSTGHALCDGENARIGSDLGWIVLTHVCRQWREVALNLPVLWGRILFIFPTAFDAVFERARWAPIAAFYVEDSNMIISGNAAILHLIQEHPDRLSSLTIHASRNLLSELIGKEYPHLQSLVLQDQFSPLTYEALDENPPLTAPVLTELSMFGYITPIVASGLLSLNIRGGTEAGSRTTIAHVLGCLQHFPMLESLTLEDAFHATDPADAEQNAYMGITVRLPHLKKASITADSLVFAALWRHLSTPPIIELSVSLMDSSHFGSVPLPMQPAASVLRDLLPAYDSLRIMQTSGRWAMPGLIFFSSTSANTLTIVSASRPLRSFGEFHEFFDAFLPFLAEGQIRILDVQDMPLTPYPHEFYRTTQSIISLSCVLSHVGELCSALPGVHGQPFFPSLRSLVINVDCVSFHRRSSSHFTRAWDTLLDLLRDHKAAGSAVHTLRLVGMNTRGLVVWAKVGPIEMRSIDVVRSLVGVFEDTRARMMTK
jgi:hypothetical protein